MLFNRINLKSRKNLLSNSLLLVLAMTMHLACGHNTPPKAAPPTVLPSGPKGTFTANEEATKQLQQETEQDSNKSKELKSANHIASQSCNDSARQIDPRIRAGIEIKQEFDTLTPLETRPRMWISTKVESVGADQIVVTHADTTTASGDQIWARLKCDYKILNHSESNPRCAVVEGSSDLRIKARLLYKDTTAHCAIAHSETKTETQIKRGTYTFKNGRTVAADFSVTTTTGPIVCAGPKGEALGKSAPSAHGKIGHSVKTEVTSVDIPTLNAPVCPLARAIIFNSTDLREESGARVEYSRAETVEVNL